MVKGMVVMVMEEAVKMIEVEMVEEATVTKEVEREVELKVMKGMVTEERGMGEVVKEQAVERLQVLEAARWPEKMVVGKAVAAAEGKEQTVCSGMNCSELEDARTRSIAPAFAALAG